MVFLFLPVHTPVLPVSPAHHDVKLDDENQALKDELDKVRIKVRKLKVREEAYQETLESKVENAESEHKHKQT